MQEALHLSFQSKLCDAAGCFGVDRLHCLAIFWSKRNQCCKVHDAVYRLQGLAQRGRIFKPPLGTLVVDVGKMGKVLSWSDE